MEDTIYDCQCILHHNLTNSSNRSSKTNKTFQLFKVPKRLIRAIQPHKNDDINMIIDYYYILSSKTRMVCYHSILFLLTVKFWMSHRIVYSKDSDSMANHSIAKNTVQKLRKNGLFKWRVNCYECDNISNVVNRIEQMVCIKMANSCTFARNRKRRTSKLIINTEWRLILERKNNRRKQTTLKTRM